MVGFHRPRVAEAVYGSRLEFSEDCTLSTRFLEDDGSWRRKSAE